MDLPKFICEYPRVVAWLSFFALVEGLWGLISGDPLIPTIANRMGIEFAMITWLTPVFPLLIAICGFLMLVAILHNTRKNTHLKLVKPAETVPLAQVEFGSPQQDAGEMNVSWWHVPISLNDPSGQAAITHYHDCTARLVFLGTVPYPARVVDLVCRKVDTPRGISEFSLRVGDEPRKLPIALRWESDFGQFYSQGDAFITGLAHQFQNARVKLNPGEYRFRIEVRSGTAKWESGIYVLRVPNKTASNGQFILSKLEVS